MIDNENEDFDEDYFSEEEEYLETANSSAGLNRSRTDSRDESFRNQIYLSLIEELMQEYGDLILKVFHKHNFTYCTSMDW